MLTDSNITWFEYLNRQTERDMVRMIDPSYVSYKFDIKLLKRRIDIKSNQINQIIMKQSKKYRSKKSAIVITLLQRISFIRENE